MKRPVMSETKKQLDEKRLKLDEAGQSSSAVVDDANAEPGFSNREQSIVIQDHQTMECTQTEETARSSRSENNTEQRTQPQCTEQTGQPVNIDLSTEAITIGGEDRSHGAMQPGENNGITISDLSSKTAAASMTAPNEASTSHQGLHSLKISDHLHSQMAGGRRLIPTQKTVEKRIRPIKVKLKKVAHNLSQNPSNLINQAGSLSTRSQEQPSEVTQNQSQDGPKVSEIQIGNSRDKITPNRSIPSSSQEIQHVPRINVDRSHDMTAVDPRNDLQSIVNIAEAPQTPSSLPHQRPSFVRRLDKQRSSEAQAMRVRDTAQGSSGSQNIHQRTSSAELMMNEAFAIQLQPNPVANQPREYLTRPTNQDNIEQELLRGSTESSNYDHRPNSGTMRMRISSTRQNSTNESNSMHQTSEQVQLRQSQRNHLDSQQQTQKPKINIGISINLKNKRQMSNLQGVTKKTPPSVVSKVLNSLLQKLKNTPSSHFHHRSAESTEHNRGPQNIADSATRDTHKFEMPTYSSNQSPRIPHKSAQENVDQNLRMQKQLVNHNTEQRTQPQCTEQTGQPVNIDLSTEAITIGGEDRSHGDMQPGENNGITISDLSSKTAAASMTAPNEASTSHQGLHSLKISDHLHSHMAGGRRLIPMQKTVEKRIRPIKVKLKKFAHNLSQNPSNLINQAGSLSTRSQEQPSEVTQNQSQDGPKVSEIQIGNSRDKITPNRSIPSSSQEIQHVPRINVERSHDMTAVDPRNDLQSIVNIAEAPQTPSSLPHQRPSFVRRLDKQRSSEAQAMRVRDTAQGSSGSQNIHQRTSSAELMMNEAFANSGTMRMRISSTRQNSTNESNSMHQTSEQVQLRQSQRNHLDSQQQTQKPKINIGISINLKNKRQMSTLQGVTKKTPPSDVSKVLNSLLQKLKNTPSSHFHHRSAESTEHNRGPQNIADSATRDTHKFEMPTYSSNQSPRIPHKSAQENVDQNLRMQKQLVNQSTEMNSKMKGVHFKDNVVRSPVIESHQNVMGNVCQSDESMVEEPLSPLSPSYPIIHNGVTSDSDAVTDQEAISDQEMSTDEAPVETMNDVYCTRVATGSGSADLSTATQNPTNQQTQQRDVLEQQILDKFSTLSTQMGNTLHSTCDMYNNLRVLILETAEAYKKLLDAVERFNKLENSTSNIPSSNVTPEVPHASEERQIEVTASTSSSNEDQYSNNIANKAPKKKHNNLYRFVLPQNYDPHDTRWTLKYREYIPGLLELERNKGIYISYGDLQYCQESKDCQSLARRLLQEVFNQKALSVCSSMTEIMKASNNVDSNVRPRLDEHGCNVLLDFVLEFGLRRGWDTQLEPIFSTLHSKILELRFKYGEMAKC